MEAFAILFFILLFFVFCNDFHRNGGKYTVLLKTAENYKNKGRWGVAPFFHLLSEISKKKHLILNFIRRLKKQE